MTAAMRRLALLAAVTAAWAMPAAAQTYETWDPNSVSGPTGTPVLSNGNKTITANAGFEGATVATGEKTGAYSFECTSVALSNGASGCGFSLIFDTYNEPQNSAFHGIEFNANGHVWTHGNDVGNIGVSPALGDVFALSVNFASGAFTAQDCNRGSTVTGTIPAALIGTALYWHPVVYVVNNADEYIANFGASTFICASPGGWPVNPVTGQTHPTWDASWSGAVGAPGTHQVLYDGKLTAATVGQTNGLTNVQAMASVALTGKTYITFTTAADANPAVGIANSLSTSLNTGNGYYLVQNGATIFYNGSSVAALNGSSYPGIGSTVELAVDMTDLRAWFRCASCSTASWFGTASGASPTVPSSGLDISGLFSGHSAYAFYFASVSPDATLELPNFGDSSCSGLPSGYSCGIVSNSDPGGSGAAQ